MPNPTARLLEILSWARPHESETEIAFCRAFLDAIPGMRSDPFGNRSLRIGQAPILWSCHVDTVAAKGGPQAVYVDDNGIIGLDDGKPGMSLGADDGTGLWIMLEMIAAKREGLYLFHRGEERGCMGSRWIVDNTPNVLDGIQAAVAFDRAGHSDIITHQANGRGCSDAFAASFARQLNAQVNFNYRADDGGVFTDTNEYFDLIPECSNISVGYRGQHGPRETQDLTHALALRVAMLSFDPYALAIERNPGEIDPDDVYGWKPWDNRPAHLSTDLDALTALVSENPRMAARFLLSEGISEGLFLDALWEADDERSDPLDALDYVPA